MKKKALLKDFLREIRRNFGRFISIFFIIALGSAFFAGVRSAKYDMKYTADSYYDQANLMDIRVISTLGLIEDDLEDMGSIEGVESVSGGHTADVICKTGDKDLVIHLIGLTDGFNEPTITEGRMPEKEDECFVDTAFLERGSYELGDTITFSSGTDDPLEDTLTRESFTIVGAGKRPDYIDLSRGTSNIGDGNIDAFMLVEPEVFESEIYTEAYLHVDGAKELFSYSKEYEELIKAVEDKLEGIEDAACQRRYDEIQDEASDKLSEAKQEVADGEQELKDAESKLEDGHQQIQDAEETLAEKQQELEDGKSKLLDGEKQLKDAEGQISSGKQQLSDAQAQLDSKAGELASGKATLQEQQAVYDSGLQQYEEKVAYIADMKSELSEAKANLPTIVQQIGLLEQAISEIENQMGPLEGGISNLESQVAQIQEQKSQMEEQLEAEGDDGSDNEAYQQLCRQLASLQGELANLKAQYDGVRNKLDELKQQLQELQTLKSQMETLIASEPQITAGEGELAAAKSQLDSAKSQLDAGWTKIKDGEAAIASAQAQINQKRSELASGESELSSKKSELEDAKTVISDGEKALADANTELEEKKLELEDAQNTFDEESGDAKQKIEDAKTEIADNEAELADLEVPSWYILNRDKIPSYASYEMDADRMGNLGEVFPVIFFLVAALVSLTAMTRMIEEQRTAIGTLKALGYSDLVIAAKYFSYAMLATVGGSVLGVIIGSITLPRVIISAYGMMYTGLPEYLTPLNWDQALLAVLASMASTGIATLGASYHELRAKPAQLMRPEAPKSGRRVFLEHIPFIWKHLNFTGKSTIRNLMRYKKRFFMTVIGIGGCMSLMLVGFGIQDSIAVVAKRQYTDIFTYDAAVNVNTKASREDKEALLKLSDSYQGLDEYMKVAYQSVDLEYDGNEQSAALQVPGDTERIQDFLSLRKRESNITYDFPKEGVALTEKAAKVLGAKVGDVITIKTDDDDDVKSVQAKVSVITENYILHYAYMAPELYEELYGEAPEYNQLWLNYEMSDKDQEALGKAFIKQEACSGVTFISKGLGDMDDMMSTLNEVIYILIISAGLLAFVVLYNLNSINITERKRELATLKVLGFYDGEVGAYVYRENILLTIIGIVFGCFMGMLLHRFVVETVEVDAMMFGRIIQPVSYAISAALAMAFSLLVNGMMYWRLKKIDMIESLKSVE